jgi:hypothetical protein
MANDAASGFAFLYGMLGSDATLLALVTGVYRDVAPVGTVPDWLVFGHQSGTDTMTATAVRIMTGNLYRILAIGPEAHDTNLGAIADRVDALLQPSGTPLRNATAGGVTALACYREQVLALSETVPGAAGGSAWLSLGGLYRIELAAS